MESDKVINGHPPLPMEQMFKKDVADINSDKTAVHTLIWVEGGVKCQGKKPGFQTRIFGKVGAKGPGNIERGNKAPKMRFFTADTPRILD